MEAFRTWGGLAGWIVACFLAAAVGSLFKPGDEVFGDIATGFGGFAEYVCVRESVLVKKPANLTFEQAAAVPMAAVTAFQGLRKGAVDYILKPVEFDELIVKIGRLLANRRVTVENKLLRGELNRRFDFTNIIGQSQAIQKTLRQPRRGSTTHWLCTYSTLGPRIESARGTAKDVHPP